MNTYEAFICTKNDIGEILLYSLQNPEKYWVINCSDNENI